MVLLLFLFIQYLMLPLINYLFLSIKDSDELLEELKAFIPESANINDIVTDDLMLISWDLNHRSPRFFSKWSYENLRDEDQNH